MSHTLNEQVFRYQNGMTVYSILEAIAEQTGWEYDSENHRLYLGNTNKFFLYAKSSGYDLYFISDQTNAPILIRQQGFYPDAASIWLQRSTNETVTCFGIDDQYGSSEPFANLHFLVAENNNGDEVLFDFYSGSTFYVYTKSLSAGMPFYAIQASVNPDLHYGVCKLPDIWNGSYFPELYQVVNSKEYRPTNHLIRFDNNQIMRIVSGYSDFGGLAFPVSD